MGWMEGWMAGYHRLALEELTVHVESQDLDPEDGQ